MLRKLLFSIMATLLFLDINSPLETKAKYKNSLINKFCIASLKSKLNFTDKQKTAEISNFTCACFFNQYQSGSSMKTSREFCRNKAAEKYNL